MALIADGLAKLILRIYQDGNTAIGPGKAELLEQIARLGSISGAAREMGMSYRRAWMLVDTMNACFAEPVVITASGGKGGGGAQLTETGRAALAAFRQMEKAASEAVAPHLPQFKSLLKSD